MTLRSTALALSVIGLALAGPVSAQTIRWDGNILFDNTVNGCNDAAVSGFLENDVLFGAPFTHNNVIDPQLVNPGSLTNPNFNPVPGSNSFCGVGAEVVALPRDGFFDQVKYVGALSGNPEDNWLRGTWVSYDPDGNPADFNLAKPLVVLNGNITLNTTLSNANNYVIEGRVAVMPGATLTIEPGTSIFGSTTVTPSYLVIERDGRLECNGRPNQPIIFTSENAATGTAASGDWGGVVWHGRACANCANTAAGDSCVAEGGAGAYGGTDDTYDGGSMSWTRIEFCGFEVSTDNELNVLTMNALGSRTLINYVQTHRGSDDLFEWFGGTVSHKFLLATHGQDDFFDFQMGYRGKVQFAIAQQAPITGADKGIEGDNNEFNHGNTLCRSNPTFANMTFIGTRTTGGPATTFGGGGIHFRRGARGQFLNSIVMGFRNCAFDFDDAQTVAGGFGPDGDPVCPKEEKDAVLAWDGNVLFDNTVNGCNDAATSGLLENNVLFGSPFTHNRVVDPALVNAASLTNPDFRPTVGSGSLCGNFHPVVTLKDDGFFEQTTYAGAFSTTDNWAAGWTTHDPDGNPADFDLAKPLVVLSAGNVADGTVLVNSNNYVIEGRVSVPAGRTLVVQPGTHIFGSSTVTPSFIVIERGGKYIGNGTREYPIIFTSETAVAGTATNGDWGGFVWHGRACANCANTAAGDSCVAEGGAGAYGGTNDNYNGGSMGFTRIEFCGFEVSTDNELNVLTMNALGQGTSINWVQAHRGSDDLFEWFGGTVNNKYLYATHGQDDFYDFQMGYRGKVQFALAQQAPITGADKGIEGDNNEFNHGNSLCRSNPQFANVTFVGTRTTGGPATTFGGGGIHFRRGARGEVFNSIVLGFRNCAFDFDDAETVAGGFGPDGIPFCSASSGVIADGGNGVRGLIARAYPNPFRGSSRISFQLPESRQTSIKVYSLSGQLVETLVDRTLEAGSHDVEWSAGSSLADGIYFYTVDAGDLSTTGKLVLVR